MSHDIPDMDAILAQMKNQFIDTALEKIDRLGIILQDLSDDDGDDHDLQAEFRREIHSLKGMGGTFQMPSVTKVCHNFEIYLNDETHFDELLVQGCYQYIDRLTDLLNTVHDGKDEETVDWTSGLPLKSADEMPTEGTDSSNVVVLVAQSEELASAVKGNFVQNGFKVMNFHTPFEAFEYAFRHKPSVFIISQQLDGIDGAEILRALRAVKSMKRTNMAMICPDRHKALEEKLQTVQLLSEKNIENDVMNFISIIVSA